MVALLLVAASLGLSNFAASVGIGVSGVDGRTRLRVGLVFGAFETAMPVIGLLLGRGLAAALGRAAHWTGAGLLIATGVYALAVPLAHSCSWRSPIPSGRHCCAGASPWSTRHWRGTWPGSQCWRSRRSRPGR